MGELNRMKSAGTKSKASHIDRPSLRPGIAAARDADDPHAIVLFDELRITRQIVRVSPREFTWLQWFDGTNSLRDVQRAAMPESNSSLEPLAALIAKLDAATFLDGPGFQEVFTRPVREPSCIGCYAADPTALREQLASYLKQIPPKAGVKRNGKRRRLRALLAPHIDFGRGHETYAWAYRDLPSLTDASLFVIIGTSHYSGERFSLTRQHFQTPLGIAETDPVFVDRVVEHFGDGMFDDPLAHIPEHSIELEVVWLQYMFEHIRPIRIVPLLVGSFHDCVMTGQTPRNVGELNRMVEALQRAEKLAKEPVCYIISGDLAHIGPKFGDERRVHDPQLDHSRKMDDAILQAVERVDAEAYFRIVESERDERRICGLPPTWIALQAARPESGQLLHYGRYVHPQGDESVSFASMAFFA
jgi:AmmeMemoRadiSam system protein B